MRNKIEPNRLIVEARFLNSGVTGFLSRPDTIDWPNTWPELVTLRQEVKMRLLETHTLMMDISLAAHFLLTPPKRRNLRACREFAASLQPDLLPEDIFHENRRWVLTSVAVVDTENKESFIHTFLVGTRSMPGDAHYPEWFKNYLDESADAAISDAFQAAQSFTRFSRNLFTFPLMSPDAARKIVGRSLGLPMALAALSVLTEDAMASDIIATGDLSCDFTRFLVKAVADIPAKAEAACRQKYRLLLVPKFVAPPAEALPGLVIRPVGNLQEAWLWARMYASGKEKDLDMIHHIITRNDACLLLDNCLNIDREMLEWLISSEYGKPLANAVLAVPNHIKTLVAKLENCMEPADRDLRRSAALLKLLSDAPSRNALEASSPLQAFKWATQNLKLANHCGETEQAESSCLAAQNPEPLVRFKYPKAYCDYINNLLVSQHNTYSFSPEPPIEFSQSLMNEQRHKHGINYMLGSMYGTLAQNYGFCGPAYLENVLENVKLAQAEFDNGDSTELYEDWIREYTYPLYAHLDAGNLAAARKSLMQYLQIDTFEKIRPWSDLQLFEQNALARYLADTLGKTSNEIETGLANRLLGELAQSGFDTRHPYQLITFNLGKLALGTGRPDIAQGYFTTCIEICENCAETIRVMALLPLSALYHAGLSTQGHESIACTIRSLIASSRYLNKSHFEPLMERSVSVMLERVWQDVGRFFPFSYR